MGEIKLVAEPQVSPLTWKQFMKTAPRFSVALDGYVADETQFDPKRSIANFNHHEKVNRLATRSTCGQVLMAIRMRLFDHYRDSNGEIRMNIFVNDCDEDVCVSHFLLKYGYMAEYAVNPSLNRMVSVEDALDATSGAYPYPKDLPLLREMAWVFEPYRIARRTGLLNNKLPEIYAGVITDVEHRIQAHIMGRGGQIPLDTRYRVIGGGEGWSMVEEQGDHARTGMFSDGITAFVSVRPRANDRWTYTIGKISPFVHHFDLTTLFKRLNEAEGSTLETWGGSDIIGGSPRVHGSSLSPKDVEMILNENI